MSSDNSRKVNTPRARLSYPHLFEPQQYGEQEPKYSCELLFEEGTDLSQLKAAVDVAIEEKWGNKPPKKLRLPFRDGDEKEDKDGYEGVTFIVARAKQQPGLVKGRTLEPVTDRNDIYGGCYVIANVTAFAYEHKQGGKGVSFALNHVLKVADGERFGGEPQNASQVFESADIDPAAFGDEVESNLI